jgi:hypothetical protein
MGSVLRETRPARWKTTFAERGLASGLVEQLAEYQWLLAFIRGIRVCDSLGLAPFPVCHMDFQREKR